MDTNNNLPDTQPEIDPLWVAYRDTVLPERTGIPVALFSRMTHSEDCEHCPIEGCGGRVAAYVSEDGSAMVTPTRPEPLDPKAEARSAFSQIFGIPEETLIEWENETDEGDGQE